MILFVIHAGCRSFDPSGPGRHISDRITEAGRELIKPDSFRLQTNRITRSGAGSLPRWKSLGRLQPAGNCDFLLYPDGRRGFCGA